MTDRSARITVIGGGIAGASLTFGLASRGADVTVIDDAMAGQATAASAGIIAPWVSTSTSTYYDTYAVGGDFYPEFLDRLRELGIPELGYRRTGALVVNRNPETLAEAAETIRARVAAAGSVAGEVCELDAAESAAVFPVLAAEMTGLLVTGGGRVDGRTFRDAILTGAALKGAKLIHDAAHTITAAGARTWSVGTTSAREDFDALVIAGGARSAAIMQTLDHHYITPFDGGRIVIGATREDGVGFDVRTTAEGQKQVLDDALSIAPGLAEASVLETRIGIRPMSVRADGLPFAGPVPGAETVSGFGTWITFLALQVIIVEHLHAGAIGLGWLGAARWLPYLLFGLVLGALIDRVRRRPVMIASDLVRAGLLCLIPLLWWSGRLSLPILLVLVAVLGTATLINDSASQAFVPRLIPSAALQSAHARIDGTNAAAETAGPALGGGLLALIAAPVVVLVNVATYLFSALVLGFLRVEEPRSRAPGDRPGDGDRKLLREIGAGLRWVYANRSPRDSAIWTHVWFAAQAILLTVAADYILSDIGLDAFWFGIIVAGSGLGGIIGAVAARPVGLRLGNGRTVILAHAISTVGVLVLLAAMPVHQAASADQARSCLPCPSSSSGSSSTASRSG